MVKSGKHPQKEHSRFRKQWVLILLVLGVIFLSSLAFSKPISQGGQQATSTEVVATETPASSPESEEEPPTPEEIGYTDGIIFCGTVLVLILLVGTLRETLRRKGH